MKESSQFLQREAIYGGWIDLIDFLAVPPRGTIFATSVCFTACQLPSEKGSTLKGKNLLPLGTNSFLLEESPFRRSNFDKVTFPEKVSIHLIGCSLPAHTFVKLGTSSCLNFWDIMCVMLSWNDLYFS